MATFYLELPIELGGVRFGPFLGAVTLGSEPKRCQVVLDPSLGIFPLHVTIVETTSGAYTVAPAGRECKVFLMPDAQPHLWPVTGPVQARVGDQVIVGTPAGPRFRLATDRSIAAGAAAPTSGTDGARGLVQGVAQAVDGALRPTGSGIGAELHRRAVAEALATPGPLRSFYTLWTRLRSGGLLGPQLVVGLLFAAFGMLGAGTLSCSGLLYLLGESLGIHR